MPLTDWIGSDMRPRTLAGLQIDVERHAKADLDDVRRIALVGEGPLVAGAERRAREEEPGSGRPPADGGADVEARIDVLGVLLGAVGEEAALEFDVAVDEGAPVDERDDDIDAEDEADPHAGVVLREVRARACLDAGVERVAAEGAADQEAP